MESGGKQMENNAIERAKEHFANLVSDQLERVERGLPRAPCLPRGRQLAGGGARQPEPARAQPAPVRALAREGPVHGRGAREDPRAGRSARGLAQLAGQRSRQQLGQVHHARLGARGAQPALPLEVAAGIRGDRSSNRKSAQRGRVPDSPRKRHGQIRLSCEAETALERKHRTR